MECFMQHFKYLKQHNFRLKYSCVNGKKHLYLSQLICGLKYDGANEKYELKNSNLESKLMRSNRSQAKIRLKIATSS